MSELIDAQPERTNGKTLAARAAGKLEFVDVSFTYQGQGKPALQYIDLTIRPGETAAFVGMSGGGNPRWSTSCRSGSL